jgi:hypothetical protein
MRKKKFKMLLDGYQKTSPETKMSQTSEMRERLAEAVLHYFSVSAGQCFGASVFQKTGQQ